MASLWKYLTVFSSSTKGETSNQQSEPVPLSERPPSPLEESSDWVLVEQEQNASISSTTELPDVVISFLPTIQDSPTPRVDQPSPAPDQPQEPLEPNVPAIQINPQEEIVPRQPAPVMTALSRRAASREQLHILRQESEPKHTQKQLPVAVVRRETARREKKTKYATKRQPTNGQWSANKKNGNVKAWTYARESQSKAGRRRQAIPHGF